MHAPLVTSIIIDGPIPDATALALTIPDHGSVGAAFTFRGIVRRAEPSPTHPTSTRDLLALDYETYDPMASRELLALATEIAHTHRLSAIHAIHSRGRVGVGETSFVLHVLSPHRAEAIAATAAFIDALKARVPIWKRPVWAT